jgi:hypothetical protein
MLRRSEAPLDRILDLPVLSHLPGREVRMLYCNKGR